MKKSKVLLFSVFMLVLVVATNVIFAATTSIIDTTKTGTLTIIAREQKNGDTETTAATPIAGVTYALYLVDEVDGTTVTTVSQAETAITSLTAVGTQTTGTDGKATFTTLELGKYYAKVTGYPAGTSQVPESFLVEIPITNSTGDGWNYEVTIEPKVQTASGGVIINVKDDEGDNLYGAKFNVQMSTKNTDGTWSDWTNYIPEGSTTALTISTNSNGQAQLDSLPITYDGKEVRFRFYQTSVSGTNPQITYTNSYEEYIINNKNLDYVYVQSDGKTVVVHEDGSQEAAADTAIINVVNGSTYIVKTLKLDDGSYDYIASVGITEAIEYKIDVNLPSDIADLTTYYIEDIALLGLTGINEFKIVGVKDGVETTLLENDSYTKTLSNGTSSIMGTMDGIGDVIKVDFVPSKLSGYDNLVITYNSKLDMENISEGTSSNNTNGIRFVTNVVYLVYTDNVQENTTYELNAMTAAFTGGIKLLKVNSSNNPLAGATFKVAATEADAKAGNFLKDVDGNEIVAVSGADGYATIDGLPFTDEGAQYYTSDYVDVQAKDYYLVETQAPTYTETTDEGTVTKSYKLLKDPLKITITGFSHKDDPIEIINRKPLELPKTGGIGIAIFALVGIGVMTYSIRANKKAKNMEA